MGYLLGDVCFLLYTHLDRAAGPSGRQPASVGRWVGASHAARSGGVLGRRHLKLSEFNADQEGDG
jgi:hypothetical protein